MNRLASNVYAIVMAGGAGTRFWPLSRSHRPKQLLPLGATDEPLIAATVRRVRPLIPPERVLIVTGTNLVDAIAESLPEVPRANILAEPMGRNTAPCVAWATAWVRRRDPQGVCVVLAADHFIANEAGYLEVLAHAVEAASTGALVTVGITPTRPETGYGYLELGESAGEKLFECKRFVEKPNAEKAREFLASGRFLWNSGMFFFRVDAMCTEIKTHLPELSVAMDKIDEAAKQNREQACIDEIYGSLPNISIDHGVMEKASRVIVVTGDFGWSDVGSWTTAWELAQKEQDGNALSDFTVSIDSQDNFVRAPKDKLVALVGVRDLVIVDTGDTLLIIPRERAQDVREVVAQLKAGGHKHLL